MEKIFRTIVDILMFLTLPVMMGGNYLIPDDVIPLKCLHEHLGKIVFCLWVMHFILNRRWYAGIFRGRYNAIRILQTSVNLGSFLAAIAIVFSSFVFMLNKGPICLARDMHLLASHWYIVFVSLHIGMHLNKLYKKPSHFKRGLALQIFVGALGIFGVYAFAMHEWHLYLFLQTMFFNPHAENGLVLFFVEEISIIALFANLGYYVAALLRVKCSLKVTSKNPFL